MGVIYFLFGHNYLIPRVIQAVLGSLSAGMVFRLGSRVFDRPVGLLAGIFFALYGPLIFFSGELLVHALDVFLILLFLLNLDQLLDRPLWPKYLSCGVLLGLCALSRPTILIFMPFVLAWMILRLKHHGQGVFLFIVGAALAVLPVTIRNYAIEKDFVLISSQAGVNFYMGNNPWSNGHLAYVPGTPKDWWAEGYPATIRIAEQAEGRSLKSSEVSSYWSRRTRQEISDKPLKWAGLMIKKIRFLLAGHEISNTEDIYFQSRFSGLLRLLLWAKIIAFPFGLILPLALLGLALSDHRERQTHLILFQIIYSLAVVLFFVTARYRLALAPVLCIWAAAGLVAVIRIVQRRQAQQYLLAAFGFLLLFVMLNRNPLRGEEILGLDGAINLGNKYLQLSQPEKALEAFKQAEKAGPLSSRPPNGVATALLRLGQPELAKTELERAILLEPSLIQAHNNLACILEQEGDSLGAQKHYQTVLELDSNNVFAHQGIADLALKRGDYAKAEDHYKRAFSLGSADRQVISRWALSLLHQGRFADALDVNRKLLTLEPDNARAHHNQARIYIACDSLAQAVHELEIVLQLAPQTQEAQDQLDQIRKVNLTQIPQGPLPRGGPLRGGDAKAQRK